MPSGTDGPATSDVDATLHLNTIRGSLLHMLGHFGSDTDAARRTARLGKAYAVAVAVTYLPLLLAALAGDLSISRPTGTVRLPFLYDWNVAFMFLVSFPSLVVLSLSDQAVVSDSLRRVQLDQVVSVTEQKAATLAGRWESRFRWTNVAGQLLGLVVGLAVAIANVVIYRSPSVGFWMAADGVLRPVGYVFFWCVALFYALVPFYVLRSLAISFFLRDLVAESQLRILPLHPDKCGGLRPVGQLGLRNQYALSIFGLNVVLLIAISAIYLNVPSSLYGLIAAAAIAYLVVGPIVFMGPLLPFRRGMLRMKSELMGEVAQRLRRELTRIRGELPNGPISREDEELIDRLRKIGSVIDELPVWPFDAGTLRRFLTAYVIPVAGAVIYPVASSLLGRLVERLK